MRGIIGAGAISDIYLQNLTGRFRNLQLKAIADVNMQSARRKADAYGIQAVSVEQLLSDGEYVELFYHLDGLDQEKNFVEDRWKNYGYLKLNYEVEDIYKLRQRLVAGGVTLDEDIHKTVDGSLEIKVHDPDGNRMEFQQYTRESKQLL